MLYLLSHNLAENNMSRLLILGGGIAGQTAALHARRKLTHIHEVVVVTPNSKWNWIPSNIWVGVGVMSVDQVTFPLEQIYKKEGIVYHQAKAISIHPEGDTNSYSPFVTIEYTKQGIEGTTEKLTYDYLINATGPKLKFEATKGLGPDNNSLSVCTAGHAAQTSSALDEIVKAMKMGEKKKFLIGTGHGNCTCQGAAFEYLFNIEYELRRRGVRDKAEITWISNEQELGDFGIGGMHLKKGGYITHSKVFIPTPEKGGRSIAKSNVSSKYLPSRVS